MSKGPKLPESSPFKVLIVSDDPGERCELQSLLQSASTNIDEFEDFATGEEAVVRIVKTDPCRPCCVLLSDTLPDMTATEVLTAILTPNGLPPCPVVVLTRIDSPDVGRDVLRAGAQDCILKDWITPRGLLRSLENAAERWSLASKLIQRNSELIESEKHFRVIFASAAVGIARVELDGRFAVINDAFCRIHGYEEHELLEMTIQQVTHPEDVAADTALRHKLLDGSQTTYTFEKRKVRKDGVVIWVNHAVSLDRHADGTPYQFISAVHDISDRKRAEQQLFETSSRLQALMNALPVGVSFSDDRTCERVTGNPAVLNQFSVKSTDNLSASAMDPSAPGRQVQFFLNGHPVQNSELPLQRAVAEDRTIPPIDLEIVMPDSRRWYAEASGAPIHDHRGNVIAGVAVTVDVTARKKAEDALRQSEERRRLTLEAGSMGTFEVDLLTGEGVWNEVEYELLGLRPGEVSPGPETFFRYVHPDDIESLQKDWIEAVRSGSLDTEFRIIRADGSVRWLAGKGSFLYQTDSILPRAESTATRFLGVNYDITKLKDAEEGIRKLNADLESRVIQRTAQLEAANKELEAFTYSVSHDMRAPVRAIDGFSRILQEEHISEISLEAADCLKEVSRNAKYMGRLIDDLLTFSRLGRQALRMETFFPDTLVRQCLSDLKADESAEIKLFHLQPCFADAFLLKQVWINLLGNALKYSGRSNPPVIEIGSGSSDSEVFYYVRDNGVGFDMRYVDKLFGVFQRLHRQEDYEGTGVGLAVVQRIIHRHGGRVWAESRPGAGATFYFSLLPERAHA
ncbi:MAG: PAS domain S-box protein [Planctomyces sp.]|nr:PAS domain S-box protein [Planctomyces sp.]